jgi:aspartyl-tRNA(Asn)/glutamyl-tRNA(Gln) amidotransferase subunit A
MMHHLSAYDIHQHFIHGETSAEAIVTHFLKRVEQYDQKVGAFLSVYHEKALQKARELDIRRRSGNHLGKMAGIPIAVKDNIHVKGELTTCASKFLSNYKAVFNATVTSLLEEEDAIILGKTNLDEFAMGSSTEYSAFQKTHNPWNLQCVPGGSSGGSAAAVAARLCPLALGSDTGGSVRQPAGFCGIVGFKPTYGRVSRYGLVAFGSSLDQIGPFASTTKDIGMIMEVIGKHDSKDATSLPIHQENYFDLFNDPVSEKKIGVPYHFLEYLKEEAKENFIQSIEQLKSLGCQIVDIDLSILKYSIATYYIIATAEAATNLARFDGIRYGVRAQGDTLDQVYCRSRTEGFGAEVKRRILLGTYVLSSGYQDAYYKQATKVRIKIIEEYQKAFQKCDVIATPVSPVAAFPLGSIQDPLQMYLQDIYMIGANLARLPAISVPSGFNREKKPFGLHFLSDRREDRLVCQIAYAFEKSTGYAKEIPPLFY